MMNQQNEKAIDPGVSPVADGGHHDATDGSQRSSRQRLQKGLPARKKTQKNNSVPPAAAENQMADADYDIVREIDAMLYFTQQFIKKLQAKKKEKLEQLAAAPAPHGGSVIDMTKVLVNKRRAFHRKISKG